MIVHVRDLQADMTLGYNGIVLEIRDNKDTLLGKLRIGSAKVEWCKGRKSIGNGQEIRLERLVELIESEK